MQKYKNETINCPFCKSINIVDNCEKGIVFENNIQITWECCDCNSTWDIVYSAYTVVNKYKGRNSIYA